MLTILRYSLARWWSQILGWGLSLAFLAGYVVLLHDSFVAQQQNFLDLVNAYPPELMAAFGGTSDLFSPQGFLNFTFFSYMTLVFGFYMIMNGSSLLAEDEENGKLDLILAHPLSRKAIFFGRLLALGLSALAILFLTWLGFIAVIPGTKLEVSAGEMALPILDLFSFMWLFGTLALLLSMLLPSRRMASTWAGMILVGSYILTTLTRLDDRIQDIEKFTPLHYYKGGYAIEGLDWASFLGMVAIAFVFIALACWRFERRDIRVAGEGSWVWSRK